MPIVCVVPPHQQAHSVGDAPVHDGRVNGRCRMTREEVELELVNGHVVIFMEADDYDLIETLDPKRIVVTVPEGKLKGLAMGEEVTNRVLDVMNDWLLESEGTT